MRIFVLFLLAFSFLAAHPRSLTSGYSYLSHLRSLAGMTPLGRNQLLERAAKNHDLYMIANNVFGHGERQGDPHFTGATPADRAVYAGYPSRYVLENIAGGDKSIEESIDGLFSAIYHRFGFLDFTIDEVGAAFDTNPDYSYQSVSTFDMGNKEIARLCEGPEFNGYGSYTYNICADPNKKISATKFHKALEDLANQNPSIVLWPYKNATDIPPVFYDEHPDPLPECSVSGYPVSVNFNPFKTSGTPQMIEFSLQNEEGDEVPLVRTMTHDNDPSGHFSVYDFAIFPQNHLDWNAVYHARFVYSLDGQTHTIEWHFRTRALPTPHYIVQEDGKSYRVVSGKKYFFYFPPRDCNDKLTGFSSRYRGNINYQRGFYDQNTLWIQLDGPIGSEVDIRFYNGRSMKVVIASSDDIQDSSGSSSSAISSASSQSLSSSSSFSSQSSSEPECPNGYFYDPNLGLCTPLSSSSSSAVSSSSESSDQDLQELCEESGGVWADTMCIFPSSSTSSSQSSIMSSESSSWSSSFSSSYSSSSSSPFVEPGSCPSDTILIDGHCVDKAAYELAGKTLPINGYFAHYGDGVFDWVYLNYNGHIFAKLEGMDPQTGLLRWKRLRSFFDRVEYRNGYIIVGAARSTSDEVVNTLANKRLRVNGYFTYFGDPEDYDPFMWAYVSSSGHLVAKLEGMDPSTGHLKWHFLISPRVHKLQWVRIQNDRLIFGPLAQ